MFWSRKNYKHWFIRKNLKKHKFIQERVENTLSWIKKFMIFFINKKTEYKFGFNLETKKYIKIYFYNALINFTLVFISLLVFLFFSYDLISNLLWNNSINLIKIDAWSILINLFIIIIFLIRFHCDLLRSCLRGTLIKKFKKNFLIIDLLTLNIISLIGNIYANMTEDYLNRQFIPISKDKIYSYKKYSNWWINLSLLWFLLFCLIFSFLVWFFSYINHYYNYHTLKTFEIIILLAIFLTFPYWVFTYIPSLIISNILINNLFKNIEKIELPVILSLIRYLAFGVDFNLSAIFIAEFELHQYLLNSDNNFYEQL